MAFISILFLFPVSGYAALDIMRVSLLEGEVQIFTEETGEWVPASINMPIQEGDRVWAADGGRVELNFKDGTYLRLDQKSAVEILNLEKNSYQLHLSTGRIFANYKGKDDSLLQIDTPEASIRAYEKGKFRVDVFDTGRTEITNFRGTIHAESGEGRTEIERGRTLSITERGDAEFGPLPPVDEWEKWNRQRDTKLADWRPPAKHLPEDLRSYSRDFDDNGRWVYSEEYGHV
jgi:ferric-dicitrate binding protein FerR (iron transport regulator)